jgi:hypothetical protein
VAPLEASSLFGNLRRVYRNPRGLTIKLTKSAGCPKRVGSQVPRGPALLRRPLLGVFPRIKLTTLEIVLIRLQTRFNYFAILEKDKLCTLLCRENLNKYLEKERSLQHINLVPCFVVRIRKVMQNRNVFLKFQLEYIHRS